jgi:hypothetical protein
VGADVQDRVGVADALDQGSFLICPAFGEHAHLPHLLQWRLGHRAGQRRRKVIGDYDLHRGVTRHRACPCFLVMGFRDRWRTLETYLP